ncbi:MULTISPECIES: SDR family NAD(P)-dependent oxidoreductase [unclassified Halomonas]|uniref:SDR family NAD(P)-dependent oxidoreductase n=1 Tax=unclassified Halomonas TaxID=2609666 RepID=UPI0026C585DF|nr:MULTISPECIES: SDR family NAD(P)-dependent oxidoreductase [unclassified Halomonas]
MHPRVLLIAGASSGIGAATPRAASHEGYKLVLAARSVDKLTSLAQADTKGILILPHR